MNPFANTLVDRRLIKEASHFKLNLEVFQSIEGEFVTGPQFNCSAPLGFISALQC